jgi:chromosomal replication initiation ATPase DnaA
MTTTTTQPAPPPPASLGQRMAFSRLVQVIGELAGVAPTTICGRDRSTGAVQAREIVCWLAHRYLSMSYPEIAEALGRNETAHATAIQATRRWDAKLRRHRPLFEAVEATLTQLQQEERKALNALAAGNAEGGE